MQSQSAQRAQANSLPWRSQHGRGPPGLGSDLVEECLQPLGGGEVAVSSGSQPCPRNCMKSSSLWIHKAPHLGDAACGALQTEPTMYRCICNEFIHQTSPEHLLCARPSARRSNKWIQSLGRPGLRSGMPVCGAHRRATASQEASISTLCSWSPECRPQQPWGSRPSASPCLRPTLGHLRPEDQIPGALS